MDLETGLTFLRENNLDISDGLKLLNTIVGDPGSSSLKSLGSISQLLGVGSLSLLGDTGGVSAIKTLESPDLKAQLKKTKKLLSELAELGAVYVVFAVAELPTISSEKRLRYRKVGEREKARLISLLVRRAWKIGF